MDRRGSIWCLGTMPGSHIGDLASQSENYLTVKTARRERPGIQLQHDIAESTSNLGARTRTRDKGDIESNMASLSRSQRRSKAVIVDSGDEGMVQLVI